MVDFSIESLKDKTILFIGFEIKDVITINLVFLLKILTKI